MPLISCGENGYKWGEAGKCFTGSGARENAIKQGAAIEANKTSDTKLVFDKSSFKAVIDKTTGFLTAPVNLARVGVQYYYGYELINKENKHLLQDRLFEKIGVFRSPEEVFAPDSVATFVNLIITDDHPEKLVTLENVKDLQKGQVSDVKEDGEVLRGVATLIDKEIINNVQNGKVEVSVGYSNDLIAREGLYKGEKYEFVQTNIRANHLAIVDAGRCGSACRLTLDSTKAKEVNMLITIDGLSFDVEDSQLIQAIQRQQQNFDAEKAEMKKKLDEMEEEKEKMKEEKDKAEASKDALEKSQLDDAALNALINERALLLSTAKTILGDKLPECDNCPKEIKAAVIDHVLSDMDLSGKSDAYIDAAYDMSITTYDKRSKASKALSDDFNSSDRTVDKEEVTRESIRAKYIRDHYGIAI